MGRRNVGKEIDSFVKTFLMMTKMNNDRDRDDRKDKRESEMMELRRQSLASRDAQFKEMMGFRGQQLGLQRDIHNARVPTYQAQGKWWENRAAGNTPLTPEERERLFSTAAGYNGGPGSQYGANRGGGRIHAGVDIGGANGSPAKALGEGKVVYVGQHSGYGNTIDVLNKDGNVQRYALHEGQVGVKVGDEVREGQTIGTVGGRHVHHEVIRKDSDAWREAVNGRFGQTSRVGGRPDQTINPREYYGSRMPSNASNAAGGDPNAAKGSLKGYGALAPDPTKTPIVPAVPEAEKPAGGDEGALPLNSETGSDNFGATGSEGDDWSEDSALPISGDDWSEEFAEGGMAGETMQQPAPEAPLPQALDAALKAVQSGYQLGREDAALPGTDTERNGRMQAFHQGEGAVSPEQYDALLQGVGGPDPSASALQQIYGFYAQKDPRQAAQAAAGVLQAARARSMEYGHKAGQALDQRDYQGAAQALAAAYNEVPDGRSVTAEVNEQGVGRAIVKDARSGKVVEEIPLEPRALMQFASGFMGGGEFYNHLARIAQPSGGPQGGEEAGVPMKGYAEGGLVDDDDDEDYDYEDDDATDAPAETEDTEEGDLPAEDASEAQHAVPLSNGAPQSSAATTQGTPQALQPPAPPPLIPMMGGENDRAMIQQLNRQMQATYAQRVREYNATIAEARKRAATERSEKFRAGEGEKTRTAAAARTEAINNSRRQSERERREAPMDVDMTDKDVVKSFDDALVNGIAESSNITPDEARKQFGAAGIRALRNAAIEVQRYNRLPTDTAADVARLMVVPYAKDVDENPAAAPFLAERIDSSPTHTGDRRVRITFNDRNYPPIVVPESTMQQLDILRGKRAQMMQETERAQAVKKGKATAANNRHLDITRAEQGISATQYERARSTWARRGRNFEGGNAGAIPLGD